MSAIKDGGQAFPIPFGQVMSEDGKGMSLRDWFAGNALHVAWDARDKGYFVGDDLDMAKCAYQIADAMIAAREGKEGK